MRHNGTEDTHQCYFLGPEDPSWFVFFSLTFRVFLFVFIAQYFFICVFVYSSVGDMLIDFRKGERDKQ